MIGKEELENLILVRKLSYEETGRRVGLTGAGIKKRARKYELDYNTFRRSERFRSDLLMIQRRYFGSGDEEFERLTDKYINDLRFRKMMPFWARQIMAERYSLVV